MPLVWIWMDSVAVLSQQWVVLSRQPTIYWQRRATAAVQIKTNCETINLDLKPPSPPPHTKTHSFVLVSTFLYPVYPIVLFPLLLSINPLFLIHDPTHYGYLCRPDEVTHYTAHKPTLHYTTLHYTTLHYTTLHYTTLHYTTLHYTTLHYTTLHYTTLHTFLTP